MLSSSDINQNDHDLYLLHLVDFGLYDEEFNERWRAVDGRVDVL